MVETLTEIDRRFSWPQLGRGRSEYLVGVASCVDICFAFSKCLPEMLACELAVDAV